MTFDEIGSDVGKLVSEKNKQYGDSFGQSYKILQVLYPNGIAPEKLQDALTITRIIDKLFRIATNKDAFGEDPYRDICGYSLLAIKRNMDIKNDTKKEKESIIC